MRIDIHSNALRVTIQERKCTRAESATYYEIKVSSAVDMDSYTTQGLPPLSLPNGDWPPRGIFDTLALRVDRFSGWATRISKR